MRALYYRCRARDRGYESCGQGFMDVEDLDSQVVAILSSLEIPEGFRDRVERAVQGRVDNEAAIKKMAEIQEIIERIDFRWDRGFISMDEYVEKREQLEREMEALRPIDYDELVEAADLIEHFHAYWDQCAEVDKPLEARQQLLGKIVERVFVHDKVVLALVLHGDFGVVLGQNEKASAEIADAIEIQLTTEAINLYRSQCRSDWTRPGRYGNRSWPRRRGE